MSVLDHDSEVRELDAATIDRLLRDALLARAEQLCLDRASITSPSPGAVVARTASGMLLRLDVSTYAAHELER